MKKSIYTRIKWLYCAAYALLFLSFYVPNYILEMSVFEYDYVHHYVFEVSTFILSAIATCAVYVRAVREGSSPLKDAVGYILPLLIYTVPYYYLYALAYGYDSIEGTMAGVLIGAIEWLIAYAITVIGYYTMRAVARRAAGRVAILDVPAMKRGNMPEDTKREYEKRIGELLHEQTEDKRVISPLSVIVNATFIGCLARFAYGLAEEIYTTVGYLVDYAGTYRPEELYTMIAGYAALLAELLLATALSGLVRRLIIRAEPATDEDEEE